MIKPLTDGLSKTHVACILPLISQDKRHELYCSIADALGQLQTLGPAEAEKVRGVQEQLHSVLAAEAALSGDETGPTGTSILRAASARYAFRSDP